VSVRVPEFSQKQNVFSSPRSEAVAEVLKFTISSGGRCSMETEPSATLDLELARLNFGQDQELLCEVARVFVEDVPALIVDLLRAHSQRDHRAVRLFAHSLKGLSATFGAEPARTYAQDLEQRMVDESGFVTSGHQVEQLVEALRQTMHLLRQEVLSDC
jgi:HPt (histidine-containing phosphotransfer) domain-containing protein